MSRIRKNAPGDIPPRKSTYDPAAQVILKFGVGVRSNYGVVLDPKIVGSEHVFPRSSNVPIYRHWGYIRSVGEVAALQSGLRELLNRVEVLEQENAELKSLGFAEPLPVEVKPVVKGYVGERPKLSRKARALMRKHIGAARAALGEVFVIEKTGSPGGKAGASQAPEPQSQITDEDLEWAADKVRSTATTRITSAVSDQIRKETSVQAMERAAKAEREIDALIAEGLAKLSRTP